MEISREEQEAIEVIKDRLENGILASDFQISLDIALNYISKLQTQVNECEKALVREREFKNEIISKLNKENQALYESINCNDDNMLAREYQKLKKETEELKGIKNGTTIEYIGKAIYWRKDKIEKYFVRKDKIRDKIKDLEKDLNERITVEEGARTTLKEHKAIIGKHIARDILEDLLKE